MIVVSHRGPYRFSARPDGTFAAHAGSGGVASALRPLLTRGELGAVTWIASSGGPDDNAAIDAGAAAAPGLELQLLPLDATSHRLHYDVASNGVLWFLHHGLFDLVRRPRFDARFADAWDAYREVNAAFASACAECAQEGDVVFVHDYQLSLVPALLQAQRPDLAIVHFTHTPFCGPNSIRVLPERVATELCASLAGTTTGFHTPRWARAYQASAREILGPGATVAGSFATPLGPDPQALEESASAPETAAARAALDEIVGDRSAIVRVDRIEPSKNVVRGFLSFGALLEARADLRGRVVFVALLNPSRDRMPEYQAYASEVEQAANQVNGRFATGDWTPVHLDVRDDFARSIAGMQRADVVFVNPLKDGLNLVAKEAPLLNTRDATLCLSRDAGAYDELAPAAVEVHPYDLDQQAAALAAALDATPEECAARAAALRELAAKHTPASWFAELARRAARG